MSVGQMQKVFSTWLVDQGKIPEACHEIIPALEAGSNGSWTWNKNVDDSTVEVSLDDPTLKVPRQPINEFAWVWSTDVQTLTVTNTIISRHGDEEEISLVIKNEGGADEPPTSYMMKQCVTIAYEDLVRCAEEKDDELLRKIGRAYGYDGMGILCVSGVPELERKRMALLRLSYDFAKLPDEVKTKTETPHAFYQVGWSYGNEKLQGDVPDYAKGSYYANPLVDVPSEDKELIAKYPSFLEPNVWPTADLPAFEPNFKDMGNTVVSVGRLLAKQCDKYVSSQCGGYQSDKLFKLLTESKCCKGRALHYYPVDEVEKLMEKKGLKAVPAPEGSKDDTGFSDWCGWHNDHGSLTGLVPAMYIDKDGNLVSNPDTSSGLYVRSRHGELFKVKTSPGCLAFQIGETAQIHTGGVLQATPHGVRAARGKAAEGVSRETFAVFMEPEYDGTMEIPQGKTVADVQDNGAAKHLPSSVKTLGSRWKEEMDFGEFSDATFSAFY